mmetsp:Transcript_118136/g.335119  ORF Transcript_118136/g.335119 Transcript_118136/m.335119 type:complete len:315 (-) Transcript_118136:267-1211(-)
MGIDFVFGSFFFHRSSYVRLERPGSGRSNLKNRSALPWNLILSQPARNLGLSQMRDPSASNILCQPAWVLPCCSTSACSSDAKGSATSGSSSTRAMCPSLLVSNSPQSFWTAFTPRNWHAFAKSFCVTTPFWSTSRPCFHPANRLPYLVTSISLKLWREVMIMSWSWCSCLACDTSVRGGGADDDDLEALDWGALGEAGWEAALSFRSASVPSSLALAQVDSRSASGTNISSGLRSSQVNCRTSGRATSTLNSFFSLLTPMPCARQAPLNSSSPRRPQPLSSNPSRHAWTKQLNLLSSPFWKSSRIVAKPGSTS